MTAWALIGAGVGVLLGLTGAGGAVIAVPLFVHLAGASLLRATEYSLFAVLLGSVMGWLPQYGRSDWRIGLLFWGFSIPGAALAAQFKPHAPPWLMATLFVGICLFSLISIWWRRAPRATARGAGQNVFLRGAAGGILLGALVTMTGLGGGVILMPMLLGWIGMPMDRATATSLLIIFLTSLASLAFQWASIKDALQPALILALSAGCLVASIGVALIAGRWDPGRLDVVRRWLLTSVVASAAVGVAFGT